MNNVQIFKNAEFGSVRTIDINGVVHFVAKDVTEILGYSNSRKAIIDHVDDEDKDVTKCDTLGGNQKMVIINESGLYSLVLSSKLPNAKKFNCGTHHDRDINAAINIKNEGMRIVTA